LLVVAAEVADIMLSIAEEPVEVLLEVMVLVVQWSQVVVHRVLEEMLELVLLVMVQVEFPVSEVTVLPTVEVVEEDITAVEVAVLLFLVMVVVEAVLDILVLLSRALQLRKVEEHLRLQMGVLC